MERELLGIHCNGKVLGVKAANHRHSQTGRGGEGGDWDEEGWGEGLPASSAEPL